MPHTDGAVAVQGEELPGALLAAPQANATCAAEGPGACRAGADGRDGRGAGRPCAVGVSGLALVDGGRGSGLAAVDWRRMEETKGPDSAIHSGTDLAATA